MGEKYGETAAFQYFVSHPIPRRRRLFNAASFNMG
jgi:hypothetical protein